MATAGSSVLLLDGLVCALVALLYTIVKKQNSRVRHHPLPPGPRSGLLGLVRLPPPTNYPWLTYLEWGKTYGWFKLFKYNVAV